MHWTLKSIILWFLSGLILGFEKKKVIKVIYNIDYVNVCFKSVVGVKI
jgi:hypothetical protein